MSWVAEPKAATKAQTTKGVNAWRGSDRAMPTSPSMMVACASSNQLRRRPRRAVSSGIGKRSTKGAQHHLKA